MKITVINGDAGTGKTYTLVKYIKNVYDKAKKFIVLSFTHSAINNVYNTFCKRYPETKINKSYFETIHKFFKINIITNKPNLFMTSDYDYIFIDEYSLISTTLFKTIYEIMRYKTDRLILCGDYKQLRTIDYKKEISYDKLRDYIKVLGEDIDINGIQHFDNSILSLDEVQKNITNVLTLEDNKRFDNKIKQIVNILCFSEIFHTRLLNSSEDLTPNNSCENIQQIINSNQKLAKVNQSLPNYDNLFISLSTLIDMINNKGYVFIASRYSYLQTIHDTITKARFDNDIITIKQFGIPSDYGLECLHLKRGQKVIITETLEYGDEIITNGDSFIFEDFSNNIITLYDEENNKYIFLQPVIKSCENNLIVNSKNLNIKGIGKIKINDNFYYSYFPILPDNIITFHKSQGKTIDKVIVCVDSLFDFTMLYTGITRAKEDILLFTFGNKKEIKNNSYSYKVLNKLFTHYIKPK